VPRSDISSRALPGRPKDLKPRLLQQGYNVVDTGHMNVGGKDEEFTAAAGWKNRGLTLTTKVYPISPGFMSRRCLMLRHSVNWAASKSSAL